MAVTWWSEQVNLPSVWFLPFSSLALALDAIKKFDQVKIQEPGGRLEVRIRGGGTLLYVLLYFLNFDSCEVLSIFKTKIF